MRAKEDLVAFLWRLFERVVFSLTAVSLYERVEPNRALLTARVLAVVRPERELRLLRVVRAVLELRCREARLATRALVLYEPSPDLPVD